MMRAAGATGEVRPVTVAGHLAWLHLPPPGRALGRAVVICPTLGPGALQTYRALYDLASRCAAAGLPALRLELPGCGDSPEEPGPGRLARCRQAILDATEWMLRHAGVTEVALSGLRVGALLVAWAAALRPGQAAALALLAPVEHGRSQVRQWQLMSEVAGAADESGEWLEVGGELLHQAELRQFSALDLAQALRAAQPQRLLLLGARAGLVARLRDGVPLTIRSFEGARALFTRSHLVRLPIDDFAEVARWLAEGAPAGALPAWPALDVAFEPRSGVIERPLRFGADGRLAGVLCGPRYARRRVGVLVLNTGADPRAGVGRFGARMARHLAMLGFCSLRMDATGVGDSDPVAGAADPAAAPDMFHEQAVLDAVEGLDALIAQGLAPGLAFGLCAGAHAAFQLALREPRLLAVALFNLPAFDRAAGGAAAIDGGPPPGEHPLLRKPRLVWRRLLAKIDIALARWLRCEPGLDRACLWMRALAARGTRVLLAYSNGDPGLRELRAHFGRDGRALVRSANVQRVLLDGADHALTPRAMQDQALALVQGELLLLDRTLAAERTEAVHDGRRRAPSPIVPGAHAAACRPNPQTPRQRQETTP